jgi:phosphoribosylanthranilate isomerase
MPVIAKICGLGDEAAVEATVVGGADLVGFAFFPPSPRNLTPARAAELAALVPGRIKKVGLFVDPSDADLQAVLEQVPLDMVQLHGRESPARAAQVRAVSGLAVIKVVPVSTAADLAPAHDYEEHVDWLMFDAKAPAGASRPGGNAQAFDWRLLAGRSWRLPWLLAGGLNAENLAQAVAQSGALAVDVSSSIETAPGRKDPQLIKAFLDAAKAL